MSEDKRQIHSVVDTYVTGFNRGQKELLQQVLHPRFVSSGFVHDELQWDSAAEFASFCADAAPDPDAPIPEWKIETLCISGKTAVAVVRDTWGSRQFRDSLTLLKDGGRWQIVFKAFHNLD
ncbi:MAG: hypothetical protein HKP56_16935 [Anderseniella sp.]|jgi:hypothetical protein|nr:hypothetical protein [Anderseniella sp.]